MRLTQRNLGICSYTPDDTISEQEYYFDFNRLKFIDAFKYTRTHTIRNTNGLDIYNITQEYLGKLIEYKNISKKELKWLKSSSWKTRKINAKELFTVFPTVIWQCDY